METTRRDFLMVGTKLLVMTAATASALEHVIAGTPEAVTTYNTADHWWAMLIDVEKCIGGGHCVRACKTENNVVDEPMYFRTWVERYHINMSDPDHPIVDSPDGGINGFSESMPMATGRRSSCRSCATTARIRRARKSVRSEPRSVTNDGVVLIDKDYCVGCRYCVQACPYGCRYLDPRTHTADKCTLCYHRLTRGWHPPASRCVRPARDRLADLRIRTIRRTNSCGRTRFRC